MLPTWKQPVDRLGWRGDLRLQSKSAFSRFAAIHNSILKVGKGSDLTRSRSRRRMAGVCAQQTAGVTSSVRGLASVGQEPLLAHVVVARRQSALSRHPNSTAKR
jgi:hypothetical protein